MDVRRLLGNILIAFGGLNILNFYAPRPIPTVGISAFIVGGLFITIGIVVRRKKNGSESIGFDSVKSLFKKSRNKEAEKKNTDPLMAVRVLRLAAEKGGKLSVAQTAMELNIPLDTAEKALDECASKGGAYIDINSSTGIASYQFPEFSPKDSD
ncbi:MAG: hypothetical protein WCT14_17560 [Treponemataceae bacterium]